MDRPPKKRIRAFSGTPIFSSLTARTALGMMLGLFACNAMIRGTVPWLAIGLLLLGLGAAIGWVWLLGGHRSFANLVRSLHTHLPWFDGAAITTVFDDQHDELREQVAANGVTLHELDGRCITSIADLARELEVRFGRRSFPADPVAKALAILGSLPGRAKGNVVVLWSCADVIGRGDFAGYTAFVAAWSRVMEQTTPHVLLFLSHPRKATHLDSEPADAPASTAPTDAWWQRRADAPGLTASSTNNRPPT